jgi:hypothetical protein
VNRVQRFRDFWRRQLADRPPAAGPAVLACGGLGAAATLIAAGVGLPGQLVGALALVPLAWAASLWLIPAPQWSDEGGDGGGPGGGFGGRGGSPPPGPAGDTDWERFEREFWRYVKAQRRPVNA